MWFLFILCNIWSLVFPTPVSCSWLVFELIHLSVLVFYNALSSRWQHTLTWHQTFSISLQCHFSLLSFTPQQCSSISSSSLFDVGLQYIIDKHIPSPCTFQHLAPVSLRQWWNCEILPAAVIVGFKCWFQCRGMGKEKCDTFQQQGETSCPGQQCPSGSCGIVTYEAWEALA